MLLAQPAELKCCNTVVEWNITATGQCRCNAYSTSLPRLQPYVITAWTEFHSCVNCYMTFKSASWRTSTRSLSSIHKIISFTSRFRPSSLQLVSGKSVLGLNIVVVKMLQCIIYSLFSIENTIVYYSLYCSLYYSKHYSFVFSIENKL